MLDAGPERLAIGQGGSARAVTDPGAAPRGLGVANRGFEEGAEEGFNPLTWLFRAMQYRRLIAGMLAFGAVAGVMVTAMETPLYTASTRLEVLPLGAKVVEDLQVVRETNDPRALLTARERLISHGLARRVVNDLNLAEDIAFLSTSPGFSVSNLINRVFRLNPSEAIRGLSFERRETIAVGRVTASLTVRPVTGTNILQIAIRDPSPQLAARIADQFAKSYIDSRIDQTSQTSTTARLFIQDQVETVKTRLQASEEALIDYARAQNITLGAESTNLVLANIAEINKALVEVDRERIEHERLVQFINDGRGADLPQVLENDAIASLREKASTLRAEYQEKLATLKPAFPEMRALQTRISELERQVGRTISVVTDSIKLKLSELVAREQSLRARLAQLEKEQAEFQDKNVRYTILKREVDSNRSQYQSLITKLNEIGVASEIRSPSAAIIDTARAPSSPSSPSLAINLAVALGLATLLTAAIIYVIEMLNNTFTGPEQIEAELGLPVLGLLPNAEIGDVRELADNQASSLSEAYRSLRTSLQFTSQDGAPRTILVTSTEPGEGKSTTVFKLATDFAALGAQVLIIDADMRKPTMHRYFATDHAIGLSNLLTNTGHTGDVRDMFKPTRHANVTFVSSGTLPPNPADLLSSPRMALLINACRKRFDLILIDSPPVIGLADAPALSRLVEGTLLIVSSQQVTRKAARTALKRLRAAGGLVLGAALTKFSVDRFDYNYAYRYMNYGYYQYGGETPGIEGPKDGRNDTASRRPVNAALADFTRRLRHAAERFIRRHQSAS